jgi:hypothetical protein
MQGMFPRALGANSSRGSDTKRNIRVFGIVVHFNRIIVEYILVAKVVTLHFTINHKC